MIRLEDYIQRIAQLYPDKIAIECKGQTLTYSQLWQRVKERAEVFADFPEKAIVILTSQSISFLIDYFAIHLAGKAIVPLDKNVPVDTMNDISDIAAETDIPDDIADVLFTTGTTGKQKGSMISHRAIIADAENLIDAQKFTQDLNFIICGPLNHIGSLSKVWPSIIVGAKITVLESIKNMDAFFNTIKTSDAKVGTFLVPASIRMLLMFGERQLAEIADKIDFIETGAAPISQSDMETLCIMLPNARLYNTYASTETGIICTHDFNDGYCVAGCLGKPMKHAQIYIDDDGLIRCKGETIMSGYIGDEKTTNEIMRDATIYTSDKGFLDKEGRLQLTGREGDVINVGGFKVNPVEVENVVNAYPGVADCVCIPGRHAVLGTVLKLLIVVSEGKMVDKKLLGKYMMSKLEAHKVPQIISEVSEIKRTFNGKLDRKAYLSESNA